MTRLRLLYAIAAGLAVPGLVLQVLPASLPAAGVRPLALPNPPAASADRPPARTYGAIVAADPFSARRTPPSVRFVPAGGGHRVFAAPHRAEPKLYGITVGPEGAVAVISADPGVRRAQLYEIGDTLDGARVVAISASSVTLVKPSGPIVLHLEFAGQP